KEKLENMFHDVMKTIIYISLIIKLFQNNLLYGRKSLYLAWLAVLNSLNFFRTFFAFFAIPANNFSQAHGEKKPAKNAKNGEKLFFATYSLGTHHTPNDCLKLTSGRKKTRYYHI